MDIRTLRKSDLKDYAELFHYCFGAPMPRAERYAQWAGSRLTYTIGAFDQSRMLGGMWYYPYEMRVGTDVLPMGGVAAVATFPEARNRQVVRRMMTAAHERMREEGRPLAVLMPFRTSFYRRMGYVHTFFHTEWSFAPQELRRPEKHRATVRRVDGIKEWKTLERIHQEAGRRYTGTARRDRAYWAFRWLGEEDSALTVYLAERGKDAVGYMLTRRSLDADRKQRLRVVDSAWIDTDAFVSLVDVLWVHRDQMKDITWHLPCDVDLFPFFAEPETQSARLKPKKMLKIVDIKGAIEGRRYPAGLSADIVMDVEADPTSAWNRGRWRIAWDAGRAEVRRVRSTRGRALRLSIETLALLYSGCRRAEQLNEMGTIDCAGSTCEVLTEAFGTQPIFMREWF